MEAQEEAFVWQLELAAERNVAASIHCLDAFGRLEELLRRHPRPARGFLLHSYGGSAEMAGKFAALGAYFSFPGYFAHERKERRREAFRSVPPERLLVETDAPDQLPPEALQLHPLRGPDGTAIHHPANLPAIQAYLAEFLNLSKAALASTLEQNFTRLFAPAEN
jgi:TatD DNase family protein